MTPSPANVGMAAIISHHATINGTSHAGVGVPLAWIGPPCALVIAAIVNANTMTGRAMLRTMKKLAAPALLSSSAGVNELAPPELPAVLAMLRRIHRDSWGSSLCPGTLGFVSTM